MTDARRYTLAPDTELKMMGDEALILKLHDETMFSLNATGARIAELLVDGLEIDAVVAVLTNEYNTTAGDVRADVTKLVDELLSGELIVAIAEDEPHAR